MAEDVSAAAAAAGVAAAGGASDAAEGMDMVMAAAAAALVARVVITADSLGIWLGIVGGAAEAEEGAAVSPAVELGILPGIAHPPVAALSVVLAAPVLATTVVRLGTWLGTAVREVEADGVEVLWVGSAPVEAVEVEGDATTVVNKGILRENAPTLKLEGVMGNSKYSLISFFGIS